MWKEGIPVLEAPDFEESVWNNCQTIRFRKMLLNNERKCPMFKLDEV